MLLTAATLSVGVPPTDTTLIIMPFVIAAGYWKHLPAVWPGIYVVGTLLVLDLNFFNLNMHLFRRIPALIMAAPKQTEPPFVLAQLLVLALFVWLGVVAYRRFHLPARSGLSRWLPQSPLKPKGAVRPTASVLEAAASSVLAYCSTLALNTSSMSPRPNPQSGSPARSVLSRLSVQIGCECPAKETRPS